MIPNNAIAKMIIAKKMIPRMIKNVFMILYEF